MTEAADKTYTYLALGDSYTIGEAVPYTDCFPAQVVEQLSTTHAFTAPEIIATTGWTTDELQSAIAQRNLRGVYDVVTLLIGVNNQYRGRDTANYRKEFTQLLETALRFAGNKTAHVLVLSIPDWGITPFGINSGRDVPQISKEIDWFNSIARWVCEQRNITYIDITPHSRTARNDASLIASDGLHPSGSMYAYWAGKVCEVIRQRYPKNR